MNTHTYINTHYSLKNTGPIPNMAPFKRSKKISLKGAIEINPKLPKIQPKDLEKVLS